jgi:hypothetical protein
MTIADFDPRNLDIYNDIKELLHFQWQDDNKVYRYALVAQKEIYKKYGIYCRHL